MARAEKRTRIPNEIKTGILCGSSCFRGLIQKKRLDVVYIYKEGLISNKVLGISINLKK